MEYCLGDRLELYSASSLFFYCGPWFLLTYAKISFVGCIMNWHIERNEIVRGGLAARSGTEFTWSPQLRNLAEWDWVPIFLQNKYGGECGHGKIMSFCSILRFTASKHKEKVFMNFFHEIFGHQAAWCMNSSWVTSLIVIRHLGKFSY